MGPSAATIPLDSTVTLIAVRMPTGKKMRLKVLNADIKRPPRIRKGFAVWKCSAADLRVLKVLKLPSNYVRAIPFVFETDILQNVVLKAQFLYGSYRPW